MKIEVLCAHFYNLVSSELYSFELSARYVAFSYVTILRSQKAVDNYLVLFLREDTMNFCYVSQIIKTVFGNSFHMCLSVLTMFGQMSPKINHFWVNLHLSTTNLNILYSKRINVTVRFEHNKFCLTIIQVYYVSYMSGEC